MFIEEYKLSALIRDNPILYNNIAYSLQLTDFNNFIINRIGLYGAIKNQFLKICIVQNFSIVEAIIMEVLFDLGKNCKIGNKSCIYNNKCNAFINCQENMKNSTALNILKDKIYVSEEFYNKYNEILDIRNKIHIRLVKINEYFNYDDTLTIKKYNDSIKLLLYIKSNFLEDISEFLKRREEVCIKDF